METLNEQLLKKLTAAMTANPRGTTQILAESAGISRATFNRFCGSREKLVEMITNQAELSMQKIVSLAQEEVNNYPATLSELIEAHFENQEYLVFACETQNNLENAYWDCYLGALDAFFLAGQKASVFRFNLSSQMLSELFVSMICSMIDAEHRGRVAASGITSQMAAFFLNGIVRN